jgi:hypothetical protein
VKERTDNQVEHDMAKQPKADKTIVAAAFQQWTATVTEAANAGETGYKLGERIAANTRELFNAAGADGANAAIESMRDWSQAFATTFVKAHARPDPKVYSTKSAQYQEWQALVFSHVHNPLRAANKVIREHGKVLRIGMGGDVKVATHTERTEASAEDKAKAAPKRVTKALDDCDVSLATVTELVAALNKRYLGHYAFTFQVIAQQTPTPPAETASKEPDMTAIVAAVMAAMKAGK